MESYIFILFLCLTYFFCFLSVLLLVSLFIHFMAEQYPLCVFIHTHTHTLCLSAYLLMNLCFFQLMASMIKAAMNIYVQSLCRLLFFISFEYMSMNGIAGL